MYLTPELANDFEAKKVELCDHNRVYCHVSTCSTHFSTDRHKGTLALCPNAHDATCSLCKNKRHEGDCEQDLGRQQVDKMAAQQSWKKCSACSASQSRTAAAFPRREYISQTLNRCAGMLMNLQASL